jgi:hypothetical protein
MATTNTKAVGVAYADPAFESVQVGSSSAPISISASGVLNGSYASTSASDGGDTRLYYSKLTWSGTGSGEVYRGFAVVTGTGGATAGTINGAHFSCEMQGGTISGAANAVRATIGGTTASPGGTLAAVQLDTNFDTGVTLPGSAAFMRVTNTGTTKINNFLNMPAPAVGGVLAAKVGSPTQTHSIRFVDAAGTTYYIMCTTTA